MKKIFLIITAFAFIGAQGQVQNSSLQKGLIADIALSEWHVQPGAAQTSGTVTSGSTYILALFVAGDDFTNIGAVNVSGSIFKATGTTPTTWTNSSIVRPYNSTVTELISRTAGTNTDVTVVTGKNGQGSDRYNSYNGTSSYTNIDNAVAGLTGTTTGSILWKGSILDFTTNYKRLWAFGDANADENIQLTVDATDYKLYASCVVAATVKWVFTTDNTFSASTIYSIIMVHNGTTPLLYVNGVLQALTFSDETDKTAWFSQATGIDNGRLGCINYNSGGNTNFLNCRIYDVKLWNRALSIGEVQAYSNATTTAGSFVTGLRYRILTVGTTTFTDIGASANTVGVEFTATGVGSGTGTATPLSTSLTFADKGAANTAVYTSNFSAGVDGWVGTRGTIDGNIDGIGGVDDVLRYYTDAENSSHFFSINSIITAYKAYRVTLDYYLPSGQTAVDAIKITVRGSGNLYNLDGTIYSPLHATYDSWTTVTIEVYSTDAGIGIRQFDGGIGSFIGANNVGDDLTYIKNVVITPIGNTLNLDASGIRPTTWVDLSRSTPITGTHTSVTPVIPPSSELQAMDFNGTTSKILALPDADWDGTGAKTIAAWVYLRGWGEGTTALSSLLYYDLGTAIAFASASARIRVSRDNLSTNIFSNNSSIQLNTNHHIVVTSTAAGVTNIYIDGVIAATANQAAGTPIDGGDLYIGNNSTGEYTFDGMISPIRIYDRVLTATEVLDLYNKTK